MPSVAGGLADVDGSGSSVLPVSEISDQPTGDSRSGSKSKLSDMSDTDEDQSEARGRLLETNRRRNVQRTERSSSPRAERSTKEAAEEQDGSLQSPPDVPIIAQARKCNFEQFVNRFSPEEAGYAIEYLEAGADLGVEMAHEVMRRRLGKVKGYEDRDTTGFKSRRLDGGLSSGTWLQAVRIQSRAVLKALAEVTGYNWGAEPHTFMRPFGHLTHFHDKMKDKLESLKTAAASDNGDAIEHLQCYISFVEEHLLPLVHQFKDANYANPRRIRYDDLWYLFKPGELIYVPLRTLEKERRGEKEPLPKDAVYQQVWRLEVFQPHNRDLELPMRGTLPGDRESKVFPYFIDYEGSAYKPVRYQFRMEYFDGEKDIRSLEVYPIRFAASSESLIGECRELGEKFTQCVEQRHVSYKAWTLLNDPLGRYALDGRGKMVTSPEFIDGDVIVDFQEAFNAHPLLKYEYGLQSEQWASDVTTVRDKFPILLWSDASRSKLRFQWSNAVVSDDDIDFTEANGVGRGDPYGMAGLDRPPLEDLVLLPRRLFGYGLRERKFVFLDVNDVTLRRDDGDAFEFLQIDPENRRIIHCLLTDHFDTKMARKTGSEIPSQDPISGKGRNLVFLLHGPPGVGKTATVEAVAQKYRKPLFAITSGDLGSTPDAVESSLTEIFHLANVWDCILLLDEADVFLEEREKSDLKRNAVVSVFLRVLEYYNGILFLTTNRPGQLDEAIKSRVHSALLYRTLSLSQTLKIFLMNIARLELIEKRRQKASDLPQAYLQADKTGILAFAERHWREHELVELGRWNGRQIRNAFISAAALARNDQDHGDGRVAVLTERHFQFVANSVTAFDKYMARVRGAPDSEHAQRRSDRQDDFSEDQEPAARGYRQPRSSGLGRPSLSSLGVTAAPHSPTRGARQYAAPPAAASSPPYYAPSPQAHPAMAQVNPHALGPSYAYPMQVPSYAASPGVPLAVWPPQAQGGMQPSLPAAHSVPPQAQPLPQAIVQQGGSVPDVAGAGGAAHGLPGRTAEAGSG